VVEDRRRDARLAEDRLVSLARDPALADGRELRLQLARAQRSARQLGQRLCREVVDDGLGGIGEDGLAERARVDRELGADLEDLQCLVRTEDVMHHDHARAVHHAHSDRGVGALGEPLGWDERPRAQLVEVEVGVSELQQSRPELVLARRAVLLDEAVGLQGLEHPVHGGQRQLEPLGQPSILYGTGELERPEGQWSESSSYHTARSLRAG
jgi:hypothetical protein